MQSAAWQEARLSTHFVDEHSELLVEEAETPTEAAAVTTVLLQRSNPPNLLATAWLNRRES